MSGDNVCAEGLQQSQVIIYTNQQLTKQNIAKYEADLMARRLAVGADNRLIILPAYIDYYNGNFPNSLIYIATCRSTYNNTMAASFLGKGAGAYFGFDDYVLSLYAGDAGDALFDNFLLQGDTTTVAFSDSTSQVGASDGQGADFTWVGDSKLKMGGKDFSNTGFEEGGKNGWATGGDSRVITSLGSLTPKEGNFMMIISTGLGSVSNSKSSIKQNVCYSKSYKTLKFDYNIVSEEPMEYLNSAYDDRLEVSLVVDGKKTRILNKGINDSKWKPVSGIDFAGGDDTTFMTGWKSFSYSLKNVPKDAQLELKFQVSDVGDSAYDTAALIDNVRFE